MTTGGRWSGSSREDELLSRLYLHLTKRQAARFASEYDLAGGLNRYRAWLREPAAEGRPGQEAVPASTATAPSAGAAGIGPLSAAPGPGQAVAADPTAWTTAGWDADRAVTALYSAHYRSLVRLAALLVADISIAEEVVQDSFVALHTVWRRLADSDHALSYLRQSVVNRSRSVPRHRAVMDKPAPDDPASEREQIIQFESSALVSALQALPPRQREVLVLRYHTGLSEAQIAATMGISKGAVKSHTTRAESALQAELRKGAVKSHTTRPVSALRAELRRADEIT